MQNLSILILLIVPSSPLRPMRTKSGSPINRIRQESGGYLYIYDAPNWRPTRRRQADGHDGIYPARSTNSAKRHQKPVRRAAHAGSSPRHPTSSCLPERARPLHGRGHQETGSLPVHGQERPFDLADPASEDALAATWGEEVIRIWTLKDHNFPLMRPKTSEPRRHGKTGTGRTTRRSVRSPSRRANTPSSRCGAAAHVADVTQSR